MAFSKEHGRVREALGTALGYVAGAGLAAFIVWLAVLSFRLAASEVVRLYDFIAG
jgi:hypothetical protein